MTLQSPELVAIAIAVLTAFAGLLGAFGKLLLSQIDRRFEAQNESRRETRAHWDESFRMLQDQGRENEKEILRLRAELPNEYVRREDWIRFSGSIDSKLDALNTKIDALKGASNE